jgi:hypothetical protein
MGEQVVAAIIDTVSGKIPENIVNKEVWKTRRK